MKFSMELPDDLYEQVQDWAKKNELGNRSVVVKKALLYFFEKKVKKSQEEEIHAKRDV